MAAAVEGDGFPGQVAALQQETDSLDALGFTGRGLEQRFALRLAAILGIVARPEHQQGRRNRVHFYQRCVLAGERQRQVVQRGLARRVGGVFLAARAGNVIAQMDNVGQPMRFAVATQEVAAGEVDQVRRRDVHVEHAAQDLGIGQAAALGHPLRRVVNDRAQRNIALPQRIRESQRRVAAVELGAEGFDAALAQQLELRTLGAIGNHDRGDFVMQGEGRGEAEALCAAGDDNRGCGTSHCG